MNNSKEIPRKQTTSHEDYFQEVRLEAGDNGKVRKYSFLRLITEETAKMYMPIILWREFLPETI
ncbi:unnamed protein product [marine sediment metagenome]|uniref:Uncharacterized protein n=1 Tax=marine sediment metagenome TaxID=412755 RepID=X1HN01_9ZZZZ